ncbi:MAG: hypothetical protein ED555_11535 [Allomuricauda sp.]|nr:MAG: hypothetical protein ED555_11535 [Allomuricauda sp.]
MFTTLCFSQSKVNTYEHAILQLQRIGAKKSAIMIYYGNGKIEQYDALKSKPINKVSHKNFDPLVDALNYMGIKGYDLKDSFGINRDGIVVYQYVFRKERTNE